MRIINSIAAMILLCQFSLNAQEMNTDLPFYDIPDYPEEFNACTVSARMIDGLGYRYYWATEGLREVDLNFKPSEEGRTSLETMEHIYRLSRTIVNSTLKKPNIRTQDEDEMSADELRKKTLENLATASEILKNANPDEMEEFKIVFQRGERKSEFPFWNQINGPIADALWHCGQIVSHRRTSGNPLSSKVSVFSGKTRE